MKIKKTFPSVVFKDATFTKRWEEFKKMVKNGSLVLLVWMQSEIEKKLKQMARQEKTKISPARKVRK